MLSAGALTSQTTSQAGNTSSLNGADFVRKDVGNGAPVDGFGLTEIHGYAFGGFGAATNGCQLLH